MIDEYENRTTFFRGSMPLPPSINAAYQAVVRAGHADLAPTPALTQFKRDAALMLTQATCVREAVQRIQSLNCRHKHVRLAVHLKVYFASMWKCDLDDRFKFAIDAAFKHLALNDNQVVRITSEKLVDAQNPRVEIEVSFLPD